MLLEGAQRLVLRYNPGQFTFRNFEANATDTELYQLANQLNSFQAEEVEQVLLVREYSLVF